MFNPSFTNELLSSDLFVSNKCRKLQNATLNKTLDALACGRTTILALDIEFYITLVQASREANARFVLHNKCPFALPPNAAVAYFPREIGGIVLQKRFEFQEKNAKKVGIWYFLGHFHVKVPPPQDDAVRDTAYCPSDTMTVSTQTREVLNDIDNVLLISEEKVNDIAYKSLLTDDNRRRLEDNPAIAGAIARDCSFHLFDYILITAESESFCSYKKDAHTSYTKDKQYAPVSDQDGIVRGLVELIDVSKLVTKEHTDIDAVFNLCALRSLRKPAHISTFDIAIANGICRHSYGSAKLSDMYSALCAHGDAAYIDELKASFKMVKEHNPETDAYMALSISVALVQSLSWALYRRSIKFGAAS